jgi:hypothetical protein
MFCIASKAQAIRELEKQIAVQDAANRSAERYVLSGGQHLADLRSRMVALRQAPDWGPVRGKGE